MINKFLSVICLLAFLGCEQDNSNDPSYTFSDKVTVGSISEPISGDLAKIVSSDNNYIIMVTGDVHLQRLAADKSGYVNIPVDQYKIIAPGDGIQFAWTKNQIDYSFRPPVVRADTIVVLK